MKFSLPLAALAGVSVAGSAFAFPSFGAGGVPDFEELAARAQAEGHDIDFNAQFAEIVKRAEADPLVEASLQAFAKRSAEIKAGGPIYPRQKRGRQLTALLNPANFKFNAEEQYVDLESEAHRFTPPGKGDIRGPCPGLNLLANHNYLNHNGVTTLTQGIDAISRVFGVGPDLALALNAYAVIFNGNILDLTWSIGGAYKSKSLGSLTNLLFGDPKGIEAHNVYEGDASIVRKDYYAPDNPTHDVSTLHLPFFEELLEQGGNNQTPGEDVFTAEVMLRHKAVRWHHSVSTNPLFFNSAFGGLVVTTAAERFVAEFAANNTADSEGFNRIYLDEVNLLPFFSVERLADGSLKYTPGHEKLLPSWRRRPLGSSFSLVDIVLTLLNAAKIDPSLLSVGGNVNGVNTFAGVNAGDLTGGLLNTQHLLENPDALTCFLYQGLVEELIPTQLNFVYKLVGDVLSLVGALVDSGIKKPWKNAAEVGGNPCENFYKRGALPKAYRDLPGSKGIKV